MSNYDSRCNFGAYEFSIASLSDGGPGTRDRSRLRLRPVREETFVVIVIPLILCISRAYRRNSIYRIYTLDTISPFFTLLYHFLSMESPINSGLLSHWLVWHYHSVFHNHLIPNRIWAVIRHRRAGCRFAPPPFALGVGIERWVTGIHPRS